MPAYAPPNNRDNLIPVLAYKAVQHFAKSKKTTNVPPATQLGDLQAVLFACFIQANICVTGSDLQINGMPLEAKRPQRETIFIGGAASVT